MKVYVSIKQAGKRKAYITQKALVIPGAISSLRELIAGIVRLNVTEYNNKPVEPLLIKYLSPDVIENQAETGKIGFGERRSHERSDPEKAIATAILAFEDGIYRVFIGEDEVSSLDEPLALKEDDSLTFIRLTMLSGRMW